MSCRQPWASSRRADAQQILHAVVPGARQIPERQVAADQRPFQAIAQDHMGGIGDFVGIDANEAALHMRIETIEIFRFPFRPATAERLPHQGCREGEVFPATACLHLDQQGLAFMQRHATRRSNRLITPVVRQPHFVERVAGFVQHAHQALREIVLGISAS